MLYNIFVRWNCIYILFTIFWVIFGLWHSENHADTLLFVSTSLTHPRHRKVIETLLLLSSCDKIYAFYSNPPPPPQGD